MRHTQAKHALIVNVCGKTVEDYLEVTERLGDTDVDMLEINVSCPNVKEGAIPHANHRNFYSMGSLIYHTHRHRLNGRTGKSPCLVGKGKCPC